MSKLVIALLKLLLFPIYLLMRVVEEITGEGRWYRQQRRRMESDRPPLTDADFLCAVSAAPGEEPLWLAVRQAMGDSIGLPVQALYPQDSIADLWRMQWLGPDLLDFTFQLERALSVKLSRPMIEKFSGDVRYGQPGKFGEFANAVVRALRETSQNVGT